MAGSEKPRFLSTLMAVAMALLAVGCSRDGDPEALLIDYVERVARVSGVDVPDDYRVALLPYPDRRERILPLADLRIGMLDFLALADCGLQEIVGERNSGLGKVMPVSRRLVYEHRLLVGARRCRQLLEGRPGADDLREALGQVVVVKTADLPRAYWNATFGSPEFEHMFSLAAAPLSVDPAAAAGGGIERALQYLAAAGPRLGDDSLVLEPSQLEAHYAALRSRRMAGELLRALDLLRFHLDAAAGAIEARLDTRPLCYRGQATPEARIFDNVFRKYYVGRVQPYLARAHRRARDWLTPVNRLAGQQAASMTPGFRAYFDAQLSVTADGALWASYRRANRRHTRAWQALLSQCGLMPG